MITANYSIYGQKNKPNTFIGGIAKQGGTGVNSPIDTVLKLATKLNINVNRIYGFKIIGNDVECNIKGIYSIPDNAFGGANIASANQNIKTYIDNDGFVIDSGNSSFAYCKELTTVKMLARTFNFKTSGFKETSKLVTADFNWSNFTTLDGIESFMNSGLTTLNLPTATSIGGYSLFRGCNFLSVNIPNVVSIQTFSLSYNAIITAMSLPKWVNGGISGLQNNTNLEIISCPLLLNVPASAFQGCVKLHTLTHSQFITLGNNCLASNKITNFVANNVTTCGEGVFQNAVMSLIEMKKCKTLSFVLTTFDLQNTGFTIRININQKTIDSGNVNPSLLRAKSLRGAIIEFYDDNGNYVSTL